MAQKAITIYTPTSAAPHIYAEDDAQVYRSIFGKSGITEGDDMLSCSIVDNNTVRLQSGTFVNQGYLICVPGGSYEDLNVESGTQNLYRKDMIVADFTRGGGEVADSHVLKVLKGTAAASKAAATLPTLVQENLSSGGSCRQEALYQINIDGLSIASIERIAPYVGSYYV